MSAPESGSTSVWQEPLSEESWTDTVGAGSVVDSCLIVTTVMGAAQH